MGVAIEQLPRKQWTQDEISQLISMGMFAGERFELIEGELYDKMGQDPPHASVIQMLQKAFGAIYPGLVRTQLPMQVAEPDRRLSLPEPDLSILLANSPEYRVRHPRGSEMRLVIEVCDTSWHMVDSQTKRDLYERAGVPVYWIVNIPKGCIRVHVLQNDDRYKQADEFDSVTFSSACFQVSDIVDALL